MAKFRSKGTPLLLLLLLFSLLLLAGTVIAKDASSNVDDLQEEDADGDLGFLDEDGVASSDDQEPLDDDYDALEDLDQDADPGHHGPAIDDKDVVVLTDGNFSRFIEENRFVLVEFYAPWCGHCQALAPEFGAAATELKGLAVLAKVDATEEDDLAQEYEVQGFPTVLFFVDGVHKTYPGARNKDAIVSWVKKKTGPAVHNITTIEDALQVLSTEGPLVLAFLHSLTGTDSAELSAASRLEDSVDFYQTLSEDVAKLFHINTKAKRPLLVLLKKDAEKINHFDGKFNKTTIAEFVVSNKLPLVISFSKEAAPFIFENPIKKQILIFAHPKDFETILPIFQDSAKLFKGKLLFVHVDLENEDVGKSVSDFFGVTGDGPTVLAYSGNEDARKYRLDGEVNISALKAFGEDFLEDKLEPFYKSDPIPEKVSFKLIDNNVKISYVGNLEDKRELLSCLSYIGFHLIDFLCCQNGDDVKIVVGNNFDQIVLDESKDVLLEIYAPWCGHCQALEPTYNKLAKHLRSIDSLVIAKMDGTTNEHPRAKPDGFPTILFFPAGNKSFDPIVVDTERTVVAFYKFLKKHASIPFKLQKPVVKVKSDTSDGVAANEGSVSKDLKDEL